jgi:hypothetical protein
MAWDDISDMKDHALLRELQRLVQADQALSARLIVHLGEVDARGLYREQACSSMFVYAVEQLHMSESQAYLRIQAARLSRQFPFIVQLLAKGALHLTAVKLIGPHLTQDNHVQLLEQISGKSKRELELLVAAIAPKPDVPSHMRKLPETQPGLAARARAPLAQTPLAVSVAPSLRATDVDMPVASQVQLPQAQFSLQAQHPKASAAPLSPGRYKVEFTAGQAMHDKLEQLKDLLRHQVPDGDLALILERATDLLLDKTLKQRFAQAQKKPRASKPRVRQHTGRRSRYIPRAVVREVHERDGGRCTFISPDGKRCGERGFLELHHHDTPFARGGTATVDNLRLACRSHNALYAERDFGENFVRSTVRNARLQRLNAKADKTNSVQNEFHI